MGRRTSFSNIILGFGLVFLYLPMFILVVYSSTLRVW